MIPLYAVNEILSKTCIIAFSSLLVISNVGLITSNVGLITSNVGLMKSEQWKAEGKNQVLKSKAVYFKFTLLFCVAHKHT